MSDAEDPFVTSEVVTNEVVDHDRDGRPTVIKVDRREDIAGICGRIDTAPTFSVVIYAPGGNRQLTTELGIRRLQRHVEESGKAVAIATGAVALSSRARQVGIPVARKPHQVRWDSGGRTVIRLPGLSFVVPALGKYFQAAAIIAIALVAIGLLLTLAPSATIVAYPPSETVTRTVTITASPNFDDIDLELMRIPSGLVSTERTVTFALKTTGTVQVGTRVAAARVTITNPTTEEVSLAAGTVLLASPNSTAFILDEALTVPPGEAVPGTVSAAEPGTAGNVAAGAINGWVEEKHRTLTVTNAGAAAGGVDEPRQAVSTDDLLRIQQMITDVVGSTTLRRTILTERPHDAVFLATAETGVEAPPLPVAGTITDLLTADVTIIISAEAILAETLDGFARAILAADEQEGEFIPGSVTAVATGPAQVDAEEETITTGLVVSGEFARDVSSAQLRDAVKGRSTDGALSILAERYGIDDAEVSLSPGWAPRLPRFGSRITVELRSRPPASETTEDASEDAATSTR